ncbi:aquaporin-like protein [Leucosporidium creatinivorum]|uniref:Aquaporin-like protein n=1 Tax=Leucosporidium creatinivorum TaxID=106004 RepID=A0A1Y2G1N8_9BASI|nr:aquaporin-like protein [Leucosporidium creatinivorum]
MAHHSRPILRFSKPDTHGPGWEPKQEHYWNEPEPRPSLQQDHREGCSSRTASVHGAPREARKPRAKKGIAREIIHDILASVGEFTGTFIFLLLSFLGAASAGYNRGGGDSSITTNDNQTILFIALSFGMSLVVVAWAFFRVTGAAFNPAVTFSLWLVGNLTARRAIATAVAQLLGGIAAAGAAKGLTIGTFGVTNTLSDGVSIGQGLGIEMFTTSLLVFTVLMLAAEKSKTTFLAPVAIGLALFVGHLASIGWTGAGMNPARSLGPSVVIGSFPGNAWLYYVGQFLGALLATMLYVLLKHLDYEEVVADIDTDNTEFSAAGIHKAPAVALINAVPGLQAGGALQDPEAQAEVREERQLQMDV